MFAVSGGPDSLAMLFLAHAAIPARMLAATVDHGLRPGAATEAAYVAQICAHLDIPHMILLPPVSITGNIQASARAARYALLQDHADAMGCAFIATAHHADDQLETVLMRVARGSGVDGLAAVRERQGRIIRPLLGMQKSDLVGICSHCGVVPVEDPSNANINFDRVAMRQWLAESAHPFDAKRAVRSASAFADAAEALEWMTDELAPARLTRDGEALCLDYSNLPNALRRRLLLRALSEMQHGYVPRGEAVDRALLALEKGEAIMLGDVLIKGGSFWHFSPAPARKENGGK